MSDFALCRRTEPSQSGRIPTYRRLTPVGKLPHDDGTIWIEGLGYVACAVRSWTLSHRSHDRLRGMGAVYDAVQLGIERHVAIKILHAKLLIRPDAVRRFLSEARPQSTSSTTRGVVPISGSERVRRRHRLSGDGLSAQRVHDVASEGWEECSPHEVVRFARQSRRRSRRRPPKGIVHRGLFGDLTYGNCWGS